jgi:hypothetical protein
MACYSYSSNANINYNNNIEIVYAVSGTSYSFSSIAWICEFPVNEQILVYTKPSLTGTETLKIYNTDYTINTSTSTINFTSAPSGYVVIRRTTPSQRMLFKFNDGAKLTAQQLNASLHQLLFMVQEKEFAGSTLNYFYPLTSSSFPAWNIPISYTIGQTVSYNNNLYICIANHTSTSPPPNANWSLLTNLNYSGFLIQGGPNPVVFNLSSLSVGSALVWNGTQFVTNTFSGTLDSLSDVTATNPSNNDIISYSSASSQWILKSPSIADLSAANLIFADRTFYNNATTTSYTNGAASVDVSSKSFLTKFKNNNNKWVLTDPPTVYHIVKELIPSPNQSGSQDPETFLSYVNTALVGLSANITNPVKAKLYWQLGLNRTNIQDSGGLDYLSDTPSMFWDDPDELYNTAGYNLGAPTPIKYHGVNNGTLKYRTSPYFFQTLNQSNVQQSYASKVQTYGIKSFYLSIPECHTSCLAGLPAAHSTTEYFAPGVSPASPDINGLITSLTAIGDEDASSYRDFYLMGLRDLAFAGSRPTSNLNTSTVKGKDNVSRLKKSYFIKATYNGLTNKLFKRLEDTSGSSLSCLWKIPKQIIYYNQAALALGVPGTGGPYDTDANLSNISVRFTGYSKLLGTPTNTTSTILADGQGKYFKADAYWSDWCQKWDTDPNPGSDLSYHRFNEADIDWLCRGLTTSSTALTLFRLDSNDTDLPVYANLSTTGISSGGNKGLFPYWRRPNEIRSGTEPNYTSYNLVGTHQLNIDANQLFSQSTNFIPDPVDEYVYRIVLKKNLTSYFRDTTNYPNSLKSSIILEYGFTDSTNASNTTALTNLNDIFQQGTLRPGPNRVMSFLNKNNLKVYVKNETIETIGSDTRYVITLGIIIPRLKSIGYARIYRTGVYKQYSSNTADTEIDGGPWTFSDLLTLNKTGTLVGLFYDSPNYDTTIYRYSPDEFITNTVGSAYTHSFISGRNECAVKFTRIGLPSTLWIKVSVLNTDGSVSLLDASGFNSSATSE